MRRRSASLALFGLMGLVGVLGSVSDSSAAPPPTWGTAIEVPGTAALNSGHAGSVSSVSCAAARNCAAGGYYTDGSDHTQAFVVDETNGKWGTAIEVPGMASLNSGGYVYVSSVSCATAGNCSAGGYYTDGSDHTQAFVVDETDGSWGTAIEVPGTAILNTGGGAQVRSVSCATAGNCAAGGVYRDGAGQPQAFVVDETNGSWGTAAGVPGYAVFSVSCATAGNCTAGGTYLDASLQFQAFVVDETNGSWSTPIEVPGMANLSSGGGAVESISCATAGNCAVGGSYGSGPGYQVFVADETDGVWGNAMEVPGLATLNSGGNAEVYSISCATAGDCALGGQYVDGSGFTRALVVDETSGVWGTAIEVPGTLTLGSGGNALTYSVSCAAAGECAAGGFSGGQGFLVDEANGKWGTAIRVPGTPPLNSDEAVTSVSCATAVSCAAGGLWYGSVPFVVDSHAAALTRKRPSSRAASSAFGRLLRHRYGSIHGYWTCPRQQYDGTGLRCTAEVHGAGRWHWLSTDATLSNGRIRFSHTTNPYNWQRHWWPYSRHFILRSREPRVPGVASVDSPAYDWGWLALCAHSLKGRSGTCDALDGDGSGLRRFYAYACSGTKPVVCRNALGDVMRYRP